MSRLVVFLVFSTLALSALTIANYKEIKVDNGEFDFDKYKEAFEAREALIAELTSPKKEEAVVEEAPKEPVIVLETESEKRGAELYKKKNCATCHGKHGEGKKSQNAPRIAGQYGWYTKAQLIAMQTGKRVNKVMDPYIRSLDENDFEDLGAFLSKYEW